MEVQEAEPFRDERVLQWVDCGVVFEILTKLAFKVSSENLADCRGKTHGSIVGCLLVVWEIIIDRSVRDYDRREEGSRVHAMGSITLLASSRSSSLRTSSWLSSMVSIWKSNSLHSGVWASQKTVLKGSTKASD